jgi:NAD(P)-dependent dehydrogenase (short-subunit alcohol dehydrogenase family)
MVAEGRLLGLRTIVTGAAQGIGEAIARAFAREGASVAIVDLNLQGAEQVASEIEASGGSALAMRVNVSRPEEVARMVDEVLARWNAIDVLVNNAGGSHPSASSGDMPSVLPSHHSPDLVVRSFPPIVEITTEQWKQVMELNLLSVFLCCRAITKHMMERRKGRIINIASSGAVHPRSNDPSYLPYATAKGGVITFTKHVATELGPYGITVNSISPGTTLTPRVQKRRDAESLRKIAERNPMRHLVEPQDVAEAALFLASEGGRYITGINLNVNAGSIMI